MKCIEIKNLFKKFKNKVVINDLSYDFEREKIYGIVGSNGCGKSVLFKLISGLVIATSGEIIIDGVKVGKEFSNLNLGIIIEHPGFLPNLTGFENLKQLASIKNKITDKDIIDTLKKVSLYKDMDYKVKNYSLGMLQRLGIAQALMEKPKILLLDEPFNSIDFEGVKELRKLIKEYKEHNNATIILTSHNIEDIEILADEIILMDNGNLKKIVDKQKDSH